VQQFGHERVSTFGIGKELNAMQWRAVVRHLVAMRLLRVDYDRFNILKLTAECRDVLNGTRRLNLRKPSDRLPAKRKMRRGATSAAGLTSAGNVASNEIVFQALREWRKGVAREHGVPAYTVFHDATLLEIARVLPSSLDDLRNISGIGATKLERYGQPLVEIVRGLAHASQD
jgi:ATP-dependent DNA helicase RecQ